MDAGRPSPTTGLAIAGGAPYSMADFFGTVYDPQGKKGKNPCTIPHNSSTTTRFPPQVSTNMK